MTSNSFRWRDLANRRMLICIFIGFSSGLPLFILINLIAAWLRSEGRATLLEPGDGTEEHSVTVAALRIKYRQYATHRLEQHPLIRVTFERVTDWGLRPS